MITLSTAKKILRHAKAAGVKVDHAPAGWLEKRNADGVASAIPGLPVLVRKNAPIETALHEIGHAVDCRRGNILRKVWHGLTGKNPYRAERSANLRACELLATYGNERELTEYRRHAAAGQRRHRAKRQGQPSELTEWAALPTRFRLVQIAGKQRFMFLFDSPVRLRRLGNGGYLTPNGGTLEIESSQTGVGYSLGHFVDAPSPETETPDGCWTYRAVSNIQGGQFARLKITA